MTPEEKAVIQKAIEWRQAIPGRSRDIKLGIELEAVIWKLIESCERCNYARHECPGCGAGLEHGDLVCEDCDAAPDQDDPITGEPIPAGQNAELERMGREIAEAIWSRAVIAEVRPGDRIRIAGNSDSAEVVEGISWKLRWHVHPAANPYQPQESRADWTELKVRFEGRAELISFTKPDFPIEIETTQTEADAVQLLGGWGARSC